MSLKELAPGNEGIVTEINGDQLFKNKLFGFGIIQGQTIKSIRKGLGIKVYEVLDSYVAIRNEDAKNIIIE
jgi:Fe2+ transport system protein FeoA